MKTFKIKAFWVIGLAALFTIGQTSYAASKSVENPTAAIKSLVSSLKTAVASDKLSLQKSPKKLYMTVQNVLMPHIALDQMAATTLGPKWSKATPAEKKQFVSGFSKMLTRMYALGLLKVLDYDFKIFPLRGTGWKTATRVNVTGQIIPKHGGSPSRVTYYMTREHGQWEVYDIAVEGISFAKSFQQQFMSFNSMSKLNAKIAAINARTYAK